MQDLGAQLAAPLLDVARRHARARCVRSARRQDGASARTGGYRPRRARCRCRAAARASATTSRAFGLPARRVDVVQGDAGAPPRWWDGRAVRPDPARRSVHGIGRRSPAPRRQMAAPGDRRGALRAASRRGSSDAHGRCWRRAASFSMRPARCSTPKTSAGSREFLARHPDALRETLTFPPECAPRGGQLLPSPAGASHNQDGFFYALLRKR